MPSSAPISFDSILPDLHANSARQVIRELVAQAHRVAVDLNKTATEAQLILQESRASSAVGKGVAILHLKSAEAQKPVCLFARIEHAVDFKASDDKPVDLIALLISPEVDGSLHLQRLSSLSRILRDEGLCRTLRGTNDADMIRALLTDEPTRRLAA